VKRPCLYLYVVACKTLFFAFAIDSDIILDCIIKRKQGCNGVERVILLMPMSIFSGMHFQDT
jgi:hypothetical protein